MTNRLQVGIDFSQKRADLCLLFPEGELLEAHQPFWNSMVGYQQAKQWLLQVLEQYGFDGLDVSGEATNYYWLPFFLQLAADTDLAEHDLNLFLLNPRWVKWFKKCFAPDDKSDQTDPFYIAERTRTRRPDQPWRPPLESLPLRFYTRYRFHLAQDLSREKNYFAALLFLKASAYYRLKPFANVYGLTSSLILSQTVSLEEWVQLPAEVLANQLDELSRHNLPDPAENARKLQQVGQESFRLDLTLAEPVQQVLDLTLAHIRFIESQLKSVEFIIATEMEQQPAIQKLTTIPGVGPVFASAIGAELGDISRFLQGRKWDKRQRRYRPRTLRDAEDAVAKLAGLWWPRNSSGDFEAEERRLTKAGNRYLRYYLIEAADQMRRRIPEYADFYKRKYKEVSKHRHKRALVLTARKSIGLLVGLLHRNEAYRSKEAG